MARSRDSYVPEARFGRRALLKGALAAGGTLALGTRLLGRSRALAEDVATTPIRFTPFSQPMPVPPVLTPGPAFEVDAARLELKPEWLPRTKYYRVAQRAGLAEIIPGVQTPIWGYEGLYPGPTFKARAGDPVVVRFENHLDRELSVHQHGGHTPSGSDGHPTAYIHPGASRDYLYPNVAPEADATENPSTMWYHDHAMDITGENVYRGLAGFYLVTDDLEDELVARNVLPGGAHDLPVVLQDKAFRSDGSLFWDTFDHDGFLGDVFVVNGKAQPYLDVEPRKYRLRILNGSNARFYELRLSTGARFLQVGNDSWLLPNAVARDRILLSGAERADVIVDFANAPAEVFLENILVQDDGRGPDGDLQDPERRIPGTRLLKFRVHGARPPADATVAPGTALRPHRPIRPEEIVATRRFEFGRSNGAWQINDRFYDPGRIDAAPRAGTAERWILENGSGGWWHPIHIHLEAHQVQRFSGGTPPVWNRYKKDTILLGPNDVAEVFVKFRTYRGTYVFHCHNTEHEDMRMMGQFEVRG